jgi:hypothetical protein
MAKDYKYKDSTPVDEPIPKGKIKAIEPGSDIKIEPIPPSKGTKEDYMGTNKPTKNMPEGAVTLPYKPNKKAESEIKMVPLAKGGTASSRADGIAQRGKTKGTMVMCGGGMAK